MAKNYEAAEYALNEFQSLYIKLDALIFELSGPDIYPHPADTPIRTVKNLLLDARNGLVTDTACAIEELTGIVVHGAHLEDPLQLVLLRKKIHAIASIDPEV